MSLIVKICGITSETDALLAAEAGANAIGFNFYPKSPRAITLRAAHRIARLLPDGVLKVGVFVEPLADELQLAIDQVPLDVIQLHGRHVRSIAPEPGAPRRRGSQPHRISRRRSHLARRTHP